MAQSNLSIYRQVGVASAASPALSPTGTTYSPDLTAVSAGNHILNGDANHTVDPRSTWPNPVVKMTTGGGATRADTGIRMYTFPGGVATPKSFMVTNAGMSAGIAARRRFFPPSATTSVTDVTNALIQQIVGEKFAFGFGTGSQLGMPSNVLNTVQGQGLESKLIGNTLGSSAAYPYFQKATFDPTLPIFRDVSIIETVCRNVIGCDSVQADLLFPFDDWYDAITPGSLAYHSLEGVSEVELGTFIDPQLLENDTDANSDLYIVIPFSFGGSFLINSLGNYGPAAPFEIALTLQKGAIGYVMVPLTYLKSHPEYALSIPYTYDTDSSTLALQSKIPTFAKQSFPAAYAFRIVVSLSAVNPQSLLAPASTLFTTAKCGPI